MSGYVDSPSGGSSSGVLRALADRLLPWLWSTTFHAAILLALALAIAWQGSQEIIPRGLPMPGRIEISIARHHDPAAKDALGSASADAAGQQYYDDEPVGIAPSFHVSSGSGSGGGSSADLRALLSEKPPVNLASILPSTTAGRGMGLGEGDGIGAASGMTREPPGTNAVRNGYVRTSVFGIEAEGRKFVYVFDRSGSMDNHRGAPLAAAKAELIASLSHLESMNQFQIIFYNEQPKIFDNSGRLVLGTDQNKNRAAKFVGSITAAGATRHDDALKLALRMIPDVIFFLTDADEPRMTTQQLAEIARINQGTSINAIEFGYGSQPQGENFLGRLARQNGGKHAYVDIGLLPGARR